MLDFDKTPDNIQQAIKAAVLDGAEFKFLAEIIGRDKCSIEELLAQIEILKTAAYESWDEIFYSRLNMLSYIINENIKIFKDKIDLINEHTFYYNMLNNLNCNDLSIKSLKELVAKYIIERELDFNLKLKKPKEKNLFIPG